MVKGLGSGWHYESNRHSLASRGIETGRKINSSVPMPISKHRASKPSYQAHGEIYNVKERFEEAGMPTDNISPDWYEYEVTLENTDGHEIDSWDSYNETYNGVQTLSKKQATDSMKEILVDVKKGKANNWFNLDRR